jgi:hypothetical protein
MGSTANDGQPLSEAENPTHHDTSSTEASPGQRIGDGKLEPVKDTETTSSNHDYPSSFNPGWRFYVAFSSISAITLMVALDASSLGNALPVSLFSISLLLLQGTMYRADVTPCRSWRTYFMEQRSKPFGPAHPTY